MRDFRSIGPEQEPWMSGCKGGVDGIQSPRSGGVRKRRAGAGRIEQSMYGWVGPGETKETFQTAQPVQREKP